MRLRRPPRAEPRRFFGEDLLNHTMIVREVYERDECIAAETVDAFLDPIALELGMIDETANEARRRRYYEIYRQFLEDEGLS